jgi:hypothetical protein
VIERPGPTSIKRVFDHVFSGHFLTTRPTGIGLTSPNGRRWLILILLSG